MLCPLLSAIALLMAPVFELPPANYQLEDDWLVDGSGFKARIERDEGFGEITLTNGLRVPDRAGDVVMGCGRGPGRRAVAPALRGGARPRLGRPGGAARGQDRPQRRRRRPGRAARPVGPLPHRAGQRFRATRPGQAAAGRRLAVARVEDSRWVHWRTWTDFYQWLRGRGVNLNAPDYYYLSGTNKCGMGYRETNWSLPRAQQLIHTRQNICDGTWTKTPSMGWMFVPLSQ